MKTMLEYYNDNIPYNQRWSKIDCRKEYFKAMCDLCDAIDEYIPEIIKQQEIGTASFAIAGILGSLDYKINQTFLEDMSSVLIKTLGTWQAGWLYTVGVSTAAQTYPASVVAPVYSIPVYSNRIWTVPTPPMYTSIIQQEFDTLSYATYSNSESVRVFGTSLDEYVTDLMKENLIYRINRP